MGWGIESNYDNLINSDPIITHIREETYCIRRRISLMYILPVEYETTYPFPYVGNSFTIFNFQSEPGSSPTPRLLAIKAGIEPAIDGSINRSVYQFRHMIFKAITQFRLTNKFHFYITYSTTELLVHNF